MTARFPDFEEGEMTSRSSSHSSGSGPTMALQKKRNRIRAARIYPAPGKELHNRSQRNLLSYYPKQYPKSVVKVAKIPEGWNVPITLPAKSNTTTDADARTACVMMNKVSTSESTNTDTTCKRMAARVMMNAEQRSLTVCHTL
jgi:hypothetical protein